jgi:hypothetical protein
MGIFWAVLGGALAVLLLVAWSMDRSVKRRGSRIHSADIWYDVRESRRDAEIHTYQLGRNVSWSSWSRRNKSGR